jgi:hypothetical protein
MWEVAAQWEEEQWRGGGTNVATTDRFGDITLCIISIISHL